MWIAETEKSEIPRNRALHAGRRKDDFLKSSSPCADKDGRTGFSVLLEKMAYVDKSSRSIVMTQKNRQHGLNEVEKA